MQAGKISLIIIFGIIPFMVRSQNAVTSQIYGRVNTEAGVPLADVSVILKNTGRGTVTDANGRYSFDLRPGEYVIELSSLGFETQEKLVKLQAKTRAEHNFSLREASYEIGEISVNGKSKVAEINEQSYNVTAIEAKDFYNVSTDAKQVLNQVSGVRILEEGGLGSDFTFTLNGFSGQQVKFFMDGIPMDNFGSSLTLNNIPVNMLDRIEVYKGVVPVWLGTDALGGAVNIITNKKPNFLDASYSFGSFNTHRTSVNGAYTNPKTGFTVRGNIFHNYSDNNYTVYAPIKEGRSIVDTQEVERFHDRYRSGTVKLETGFVNKDFADNLLFGFIASANDKQEQTGATMNVVYGGISSNSNSLIPTLRYSKKDLFTKGLKLSLYSAYNMSERQIIDTTRGIQYNWLGDTTYEPQSTEAELSRAFTTMNDNEFLTQANASYEINPRNALALNYSYSNLHRKTFNRENPDDITNKFPQSLQKQVLGLVYKLDLNQRWKTSVFGKMYRMRAETFKQLDFALETERTEAVVSEKQRTGYGLASSYFVTPDLQLKASYEHAYRMPESHEILGDGLFTRYNPDLGPEQSDNLNIGASYRIRISNDQELTLASSFIYRRTHDLIFQVVSVAGPTTRYRNISETRTQGAEGSIKYTWKKIFHIGANATFQDITDQAERVYNESYTNTGYIKNYNYGYRLPNRPYFFGNANAGLVFRDLISKNSRMAFNYNFSFVEQYFLTWAELGTVDTKKIIPRQISHDIGVSYSFKDGKYNVSLECRNLTDQRLYDKYFLQKPGRALYAKIRYSIGQ